MNEMMLADTAVSGGGGGYFGVEFLGEVPVSEMITGDALAAALNLTAGTSQFSNEPWLHWEIDGKTVYYSKKPYRHTISWDQINAVNAVSGTRTLVIQGKTYTVSLPMGANPDTAVPASTGYDVPYSHHSEWNRLMYPITVATAQNPKLSQKGPDQAAYTETELVLVAAGGNGYYQWCRELYGATANRVRRGFGGVSYLYYDLSSYARTVNGWRPRLELIS